MLYYARELCDHKRFAGAYDAFGEHPTPEPGVDWERHRALARMAGCALEVDRVDEARGRPFEESPDASLPPGRFGAVRLSELTVDHVAAGSAAGLRSTSMPDSCRSIASCPATARTPA